MHILARRRPSRPKVIAVRRRIVMFSPIVAIALATSASCNCSAARIGLLEAQTVGVDGALVECQRDASNLDRAKSWKVGVAGYEIGLRIDLDERRLWRPASRRRDQSFRRHAAGFLGRLRKTLLPKPIDSRFDVHLRRFGQRGFAVHHACAGLFAQILHHGGGNRWPSSPSFLNHDAGSIEEASGLWSARPGPAFRATNFMRGSRRLAAEAGSRLRRHIRRRSKFTSLD